MKINTEYGLVEITEFVTELSIPGIGRDYTFAQVTDVHIACHEPGDPPEAVELANSRNEFWGIQTGVFGYDNAGNERRVMPMEACELVAEQIRGIKGLDGVFFTGDTVDFPTAANFRRAKKYLDSFGVKCYIVPGNHDFISDDVSEDTRTAYYELMGDVPEYFAEELDGFDILGFSDGFVTITDEQVAFLEERLALGRPVIVLLHAPVYTDVAKEKVYPFWGYNWMVGDPGKPEEKQTPANFRFRDLLCEHRDQVKAVFAGHVHTSSGDEREPVEGEVRQYTTSPAITARYRKIIIKDC